MGLVSAYYKSSALICITTLISSSRLHRPHASVVIVVVHESGGWYEVLVACPCTLQIICLALPCFDGASFCCGGMGKKDKIASSSCGPLLPYCSLCISYHLTPTLVTLHIAIPQDNNQTSASRCSSSAKAASHRGFVITWQLILYSSVLHRVRGLV